MVSIRIIWIGIILVVAHRTTRIVTLHAFCLGVIIVITAAPLLRSFISMIVTLQTRRIATAGSSSPWVYAGEALGCSGSSTNNFIIDNNEKKGYVARTCHSVTENCQHPNHFEILVFVHVNPKPGDRTGPIDGQWATDFYRKGFGRCVSVWAIPAKPRGSCMSLIIHQAGPWRVAEQHRVVPAPSRQHTSTLVELAAGGQRDRQLFARRHAIGPSLFFFFLSSSSPGSTAQYLDRHRFTEKGGHDRRFTGADYTV